jgi:hypothetical protein
MEIWIVCIELIAQTGNDSLPSEIGFMNITTWADCHETAVGKIREYIESLGWHLVSVEKARVVNEDGKYGEVESDQIERTRHNPNAIILGTFHSYKTN